MSYIIYIYYNLYCYLAFITTFIEHSHITVSHFLITFSAERKEIKNTVKAQNRLCRGKKL